MADDLAQRVADLRAYRQSLREPYTDMDVTQQSYPNTAADRQREVKRYPYGYAQRDKSRNGLWEEPLESETERDKGDKKDDDDAASTAHSIEDVFDQWLGNLGVAEVSSVDIAVHTDGAGMQRRVSESEDMTLPTFASHDRWIHEYVPSSTHGNSSKKERQNDNFGEVGTRFTGLSSTSVATTASVTTHEPLRVDSQTVCRTEGKENAVTENHNVEMGPVWEVLQNYQQESEVYATNAQRWVSTAQSLNIENRDLKCSMRELQESFSHLQDRYDKLWSRFSHSASTLREKDTKLQELKEYVNQVEKEKSHMSSRIEKLKKIEEELREDSQNKAVQLDSAQFHNSKTQASLKKELDDLKTQFQETSADYDQYLSRVKQDQKAEIEKSKKELEEQCEQKLEQNRQEFDRLRNEQKQQYDLLLRQYYDMQESLSSQVKAVQDEYMEKLSEANKAVAAKDEELTYLRPALQSAQNKVQSLQKQKERLTRSYEQQIAQLEGKLHRMEALLARESSNRMSCDNGRQKTTLQDSSNTSPVPSAHDVGSDTIHVNSVQYPRQGTNKQHASASSSLNGGTDYHRRKLSSSQGAQSYIQQRKQVTVNGQNNSNFSEVDTSYREKENLNRLAAASTNPITSPGTSRLEQLLQEYNQSKP